MNAADTDQPSTQSRSRARGWVAAHPLAAYVVLTYVLSWAYWVPLALGSRTVETGVGWPSQMPGLAGPAISAVIVAALVGGRAGLAGLWQRLTRWRVGWWWLSVLVVLAAGAIGLAMVSGVADTADLTRYNGSAPALARWPRSPWCSCSTASEKRPAGAASSPTACSAGTA